MIYKLSKITFFLLVFFSITIFATPETDLVISKVGSRDPVAPGENIVYTITVKNISTETATDTQIIDDIPANTTFVSARVFGVGTITSQPPVGGTGLIFYSMGDIDPNETVTVELVVKTKTFLADGTIIRNVVGVISSNPDLESLNNIAFLNTTIRDASMLSTAVRAKYCATTTN